MCKTDISAEALETFGFALQANREYVPGNGYFSAVMDGNGSWVVDWDPKPPVSKLPRFPNELAPYATSPNSKARNRTASSDIAPIAPLAPIIESGSNQEQKKLLQILGSFSRVSCRSDVYYNGQTNSWRTKVRC